MNVQSAVYDVVQALQLASVPGLPSLVVADLADYATLAYLPWKARLWHPH